MNILNLHDCLSLKPIDRKCYLSTDELRNIYTEVKGTAPTQSDIDTLVQNTRSGYGGLSKAVIDLSPGEFKSYLSGQPDQLIKTAINQYRDINKPAVEALQAQKPIIEQATAQRGTELQAAKTTLGQRYESIINTLKGRSEQDVQRSDLDVSREYGKRGILPSSGVVSQVQTEKANPIRQYYSGAITEAGISGAEAEQDILNQISRLPIEQADKLNLVQQAISQLEAGASKDAIQLALQQYQMAEESRLNQANLALQTRQFESQDALTKAQIQQMQQPAPTNPYDRFVTVGEGQSIFDLGSLQSIFNKGKTYKASGGGADGW